METIVTNIASIFLFSVVGIIVLSIIDYIDDSLFSVRAANLKKRAYVTNLIKDKKLPESVLNLFD